MTTVNYFNENKINGEVIKAIPSPNPLIPTDIVFSLLDTHNLPFI